MNFLCIAVFVLLASSLVPFGMSIYKTVCDSINTYTKDFEKIKSLDEKDIDKYMEEQFAIWNDFNHACSITYIPLYGEPALMKNDKTKKMEEVLPTQIIVKTDENNWDFFNLCASNLNGILCIVALALFVILVKRVNNGCIFKWDNVKTLRWLALCILIPAFLNFISKCIMVGEVSNVFEASGYFVNYSEMLQVKDFILGIITLIVAEVFAIGLKQKEELELTI